MFILACRRTPVQPTPAFTRSHIYAGKPFAYPRRPVPRIYPDQKSYRYQQYARLLRDAGDAPLIFVQHTEFTAQRLQKLRLDIAVASTRVTKGQTLAEGEPAPVEPRFTVVRGAIFGAALRQFAPGYFELNEQLAQLDSGGGLAVLSLPPLNPPQMAAVLRAMERSVPPRKPKTPEEIQKEIDEKFADPASPGKRVKKIRQTRIPELKLIGALIEKQVFSPAEAKDMSKLPTLQTLRGQIVGLLGTPATQLAGVLSQASGGKLARVLEGFKKSLEEPEVKDTT